MRQLSYKQSFLFAVKTWFSGRRTKQASAGSIPAHGTKAGGLFFISRFGLGVGTS